MVLPIGEDRLALGTRARFASCQGLCHRALLGNHRQRGDRWPTLRPHDRRRTPLTTEARALMLSLACR
jgi:hypothetical protein